MYSSSREREISEVNVEIDAQAKQSVSSSEGDGLCTEKYKINEKKQIENF